ncbi:MAG: DUF4352 domain-containing protein [Candidatus Aenigmarchaeota archaeon]|nr:DUF4352 domain-containing protein [Candidatus Aenigmarchaeota archaeon]
MKKEKIMNYGLLILLFFSVIFISGCVEDENQPNVQTTQSTQTSETTPQQTTSETTLRSSNAEFIGNFIAIADENKIEARFSLMDSSKEYVSGDGNGQIRIVNSDEETVYTGTINVNKESFGTYTLLLTGENFLAYVWEIPITEIKKSVSSSGTMYLNFKTKNAEFEELDTSLWGLPTYTEEELAKLNEEDYSKSAISTNKQLSKGSFEVIVTRVGFFTPLVAWGDKKEYFRVDMEAKNIGNEKEYFSPLGLAILDNQGNQYETEYGGTLDTFSQIYPSVKKSGYILFEKIPKTTQTIKLVFELGYDENYDYYSFEYNIPLSE